ncbi:MAG: hypothetical protein KKC46_14585 [Proteobacteria bacterium]|nr:hypothetical protein [Pseudomonadota bacterium]
MDIFLVLWKKKILIIGGTLICIIFAAIYSLYSPKIYQVQMKIRPGYVKLGSGYLEALVYIKGKIDANIYDEEIIREIPALGLKQKPDDIDFKVSIPKNSDILDITLDISDVESGKKILQHLYSLILKEDNILMEGIINAYDQEIGLEKIKLDENSLIAKSKLLELGNIDQRIASLEDMVADAKANSEILVIEQRKIAALAGKKDEKSLEALLYIDTIQGDLSVVNNFMNAINTALQKWEVIKKDRDLLVVEKNKISKTILKIEILKSQVSKMTMVLAPKSGEYPIKPKKRLIVMLAGIAGLFLMVMTAFLLEYVSNYQKKNISGDPVI